MRLEQTLVPRAEAGAGRTQVRWYPTHGYQRDQPSRLLAPALPLHGGEADETLNPPALPLLDSGSHINARGQRPKRATGASVRYTAKLWGAAMMKRAGPPL